MKITWTSVIASLFLLISVSTKPTTAPGPVAVIGLVSSVVSLSDFIWNKVAPAQMAKQKEILELNQKSLLKNIANIMVEQQKKTYINDAREVIDDSLDFIHRRFKDMVQCNATLVDNKNGSCQPFDNFIKNKTALSYLESAHVYFDGKDKYRESIRSMLRYFALGSKNLLNSFKNFPKNKIYMVGCGGQSMQKLLDEYRQAVQVAEVEYLLMLRIIHQIMLVKTTEEHASVVKGWIDVIRAEMDQEHLQIMMEFEETARLLPRDVWRCDPHEEVGHVQDKTYMKLNNLFQGYIENQFQIIPREGKYNCGFFVEDKYFCGGVDPVNPLTRPQWSLGQNKRVCSGELWNCTKRFFNDERLRARKTLSICPAKKKSDRRYEYAWVKGYFGGVLENQYQYIPDKRHCDKPEYEDDEITRADCPMCYCVCADKYSYKNFEKTGALSDRAFFMLASHSDFQNNYVVVGARLRKKYGVIYIQVQQGKLISNGNVNGSTVHWKEIDDDLLKNPANHIYITWNSTRSIQMEDIDLKNNVALTGLGVSVWGKEKRFRLIAHGTSFDFVNGILDPASVGYRGLKPTKTNVMQVREKLLPSIDSNDFIVTNKSISFDISNMDTDLGQNTIPFIDIQDVTTDRPAVLGGAGLYYKILDVNSTRAGYIGLKLKTYDFVPHINLDTNIFPELK